MGKKTGIRADANDTIGAGHIMRCITIARQLRKLGQETVFFTADASGHPLLEEAGMDYVNLESRWDCMEEECEELLRQLEQTGCDRLLVDSYQVTEAYFESLGKQYPVIYLDDCFEGVYPVDLLINYNAFHSRFPYQESYGEETQLLLGTAYVPLREEFSLEQYPKYQKFQNDEKFQKDQKFQYDQEFQDDQRLHKDQKFPKCQKEESHVLLSAGGGDVCDALAGLLETIIEEGQFQDVIFHVVVGRYHRNKEGLVSLAGRHPGIRIHENVSRMGELMSQCDAAFSAAGTMLFELSAMQVPTVFFVCADNQQYDSEFFSMEDRMLFAGDIRTERKRCLREACRMLKRLLQDKMLVSRMKQQLFQVTDGQGARRIAEAIAAVRDKEYISQDKTIGKH